MKSVMKAAGYLLASAFAFAQVPAARAADEVRNLRLGYILQETHPQGLGARKMAEIAAQKSNNRLKIQTFGNGVLGDELKMAASLQGGVLDLLIITTSPLTGTVKELGVLDTPFLFQSPEEVDAVLQGPIGDKLLAKLTDRGMVGLSWMETGFRSMTNSKRAVNRADDIQGLKFRTMQNKIFIDSFNALGANAVPLPLPEVFTAMETKAVDGAEAPPAGIESSQWYEVQKYLVLTRHAFAALMVVASKKTWDSLSEADRAILRDAALEASSFERTTNRQQERDAVASLQKKGMVVTELTTAEADKLRARVRPVADGIARVAGVELMQEVQTTIAKVRK